MQRAPAKQVGWQLSLCFQTCPQIPRQHPVQGHQEYCTAVSYREWQTAHCPTCSASSSGEAQREALQGHLCCLAHREQRASSSMDLLSTETVPAFIPWMCFVPSYLVPLRMNLQCRGLALAGLEAISITQLVRQGVNFWLNNDWPHTVRPFPLHWASSKMQPRKTAGSVTAFRSLILS